MSFVVSVTGYRRCAYLYNSTCTAAVAAELVYSFFIGVSGTVEAVAQDEGNVIPNTKGNSFNCSPNTHETTVLLPTS